jgi:Mn2+/Fe2+ NRAMP family transporter
MGSGIGVMFAIMTTAAVTLGAHGAVQVSTAQQAAQALRPLAGNLAGLLFAAGIVGTGLLPVPVLAGSTAYAVAETLGWREGLGRRVVQARAFYAVIAVSILIGVAMDVLGRHRSGLLSQLLVGAAAVAMTVLSLLVVLR